MTRRTTPHAAGLAFALALMASAAPPATAQPAGTERYATLPAASPDGKRIAFTRGLPEGRQELWVIGVNGSHPRRLDEGKETGFLPGWIVGGRRVAYNVHQGDSVSVRAVGADGSEPRTLFTLAAKAAKLSNDGRRVAYVVGTWTRGRLVVADADGGNVRALTDSSAGWFNIAWSPDDQQLAVARRDSSGELQVWLVDPRSGEARALTAFGKSEGRPQWPAWSPDGRRVAVQAGTYSREHPETSTSDIWVIEVATGQATRITQRPRPWLDETPSFLPDGRIAFQSTRSGRFDIWVMGGDGSRPQQVTR
jgi:Tol biopolymer transport system component